MIPFVDEKNNMIDSFLICGDRLSTNDAMGLEW